MTDFGASGSDVALEPAGIDTTVTYRASTSTMNSASSGGNLLNNVWRNVPGCAYTVAAGDSGLYIIAGCFDLEWFDDSKEGRGHVAGRITLDGGAIGEPVGLESQILTHKRLVQTAVVQRQLVAGEIVRLQAQAFNMGTGVSPTTDAASCFVGSALVSWQVG